MDTTDGVYYLGFKITDLAVLKPMQRIFENIKKGIWSDEEQYRVVHRVKFNRNFKHTRLCSAKVGNHEFPKLVDAFKVFTEDHAEELQAVRARFSELQCEHLNGRIRVWLTLCPESFKMISDLQNEVIAHFKEFQDTETTWRFDLRCRLLSLNTVIPFEMVEKVVSEFSSEVKNLDALLGPFSLESQRRTLCQYPPLTPALSDVADDVPEWVPRSLCVLGFSEGDPSEIFQSIAQWSSFDLEADAIERCYWGTQYYEWPRIVVVFRDTPLLRDEFYANFMRSLARSGGRVPSNEFVSDRFQVGSKVGIYKTMPQEKDRMFLRSERICWRDLRNLYRPKVDDHLDLYLHQLAAPHQQHYFGTQDDLDELIELLRSGNTTEYLTSFW